jgi:glyoxylate reductase
MRQKPKVLLTEPVFQDVSSWLNKHVDLHIGERHQFNDEAALAEKIRDFDGILSMLSNPVTEKVIQAGEHLKIVANHAVGLNNVDVSACQKKGVKVAYTPGVLSEATADGTLALMLSLIRRIPESQQFLREGKFDGWHPTTFLGLELNGATMGIIGMGRIGQAVARRCRAFGMDVVYHNRKRLPGNIEASLNARYINTPAELAQISDIVSFHCPLTPETHHLADKTFLESMKPGSYLINTSRGPVVDEAALAQCLLEQRISGAGLDVFEEEPDLHPLLKTAPNTVFTPHITSATFKTRRKMGMLCAGAILNELCGMQEEACFYT